MSTYNKTIDLTSKGQARVTEGINIPEGVNARHHTKTVGNITYHFIPISKRDQVELAQKAGAHITEAAYDNKLKEEEKKKATLDRLRAKLERRRQYPKQCTEH